MTIKKKKFYFTVLSAGVLIGSTIWITHTLREDPTILENYSEMLHPTAYDALDLIDVPLENQLKNNPLENGCEITSLSMLLRYYRFDTTKNQLAEMLDYVPLVSENGLYGNPHKGFVGNIEAGYESMGVGVEPLEKVAEEVVGNDYQVEVSTTKDFSEIEEKVNAGVPVLVITTVDFEVPTEEDLWEWQTEEGLVTVSPLCHAVVITGIEGDTVYVNDPYGYRHREVDRDDFQIIYEKMGQQSLYLV
jgi:uncharacterized protein YvpB